MKRKNKFNLTNFSFCDMDDVHLLYLIDYLECRDVVDKSEVEIKFLNGDCIEKKWQWYDELIIRPKQIIFCPSSMGQKVILTAEEYLKMRKIFI